jgi:hypothetical protein
LAFPEPPPSSWGNEDCGIDPDLMNCIQKETSLLDEQYWSTFGDNEHDIYLALLRYMERNASELEVRRP